MKTNGKKTLGWAAAVVLVFGSAAQAATAPAGGDKYIVIRWNLFEGSPSQKLPGSPVVVSTTPKVPSVLQLAEASKDPDKNLASIQQELTSIYQLASLRPLATNTWSWSRKNEKVINALLLQQAVLPIAFTPREKSGNKVSVRVQVSQPGPGAVKSAESASDYFIDMELMLGYNESIVLGFKWLDKSYFLAFEALKADVPGSDPGTDSFVDEIAFLPASQPLVQPLPSYPPACKTAGIGGTVILRVDLDASGSVTRSEILKGVHPDLDQAAREAVLGWKYKPVLKDGKPVPVSFSLSISFNPDRPAFPAAAPAAEESVPPKIISASTGEEPDPRLAGILDKASAYCEKLRGAGLYFVCREQIEEWILSGQSTSRATSAKAEFYGYTERNPPAQTRIRTDLLYDYQLRKEKEALTEQRTLLVENGVKKEEKNAPLKTRRFFSTNAVYGPVGFLAREWRATYDFKLLKEQKVEGRKAYVIEARPKVRIEGKPNFGQIWVDQADFSILRIDIEQESLPGFETIAAQARQDNFKPVFSTSHIYGIEKNSLRFPSQTVFNEKYKKIFRNVGFGASEVTLSNTTIHYRDYRFFTVDVDIDYRAPLDPWGRRP